MNAIKLAGIKEPVPVSQIMYVLGDGNYSNVYFSNGKLILASMTLKDIQKQSTTFLRISKGTLVYRRFIVVNTPSQRINKRIETICMQDGKDLSVSRRRWRVLLEQAESIQG